MNVEILKSAGIAYEKGIARFLGDANLYETILDMFTEDETFMAAEEAYKAAETDGDYTQLFRCIHTMKGVSGNVDITLLYKYSCELTEYLRNNDTPDRARVAAMFNNIKEAYNKALHGIIQAKENK